MLRLKGIKELPQEKDGFRILIDEHWPQGLSKEEAKVDLWIKEIKPTKDLDEWPENDPKYFEEPKYGDEIHRQTLIKFIRETEKEKGTVTFLCSTIESLMQLQF